MRRLPLLLILAIGIGAPLAATLLFYFAPPSSHIARGEVLPPSAAPADWNLRGGKWTLLIADETGKCGAQCRKRLCQMRQLRLMLPGHYLRLQRVWLRSENANSEPEIAAKNLPPPLAGEGRSFSPEKLRGDGRAEESESQTLESESEKVTDINPRTAYADTAPPIFASADCGETRAAAYANNAAQINITDNVAIVRGDANALPKPADGKVRADYLYLIDPAGIYAMRFPPALDIYEVRKDIAKLLRISKGRRRIADK